MFLFIETTLDFGGTNEDLNTSHVLIYQPANNSVAFNNAYLNTSHVLIYQ